ncbi:hypothetical protein Tco_0109955 [Tanacetum coccineum]
MIHNSCISTGLELYVGYFTDGLFLLLPHSATSFVTASLFSGEKVLLFWQNRFQGRVYIEGVLYDLSGHPGHVRRFPSEDFQTLISEAQLPDRIFPNGSRSRRRNPQIRYCFLSSLPLLQGDRGVSFQASVVQRTLAFFYFGRRGVLTMLIQWMRGMDFCLDPSTLCPYVPSSVIQLPVSWAITYCFLNCQSMWDPLVAPYRKRQATNGMSPRLSRWEFLLGHKLLSAQLGDFTEPMKDEIFHDLRENLMMRPVSTVHISLNDWYGEGPQLAPSDNLGDLMGLFVTRSSY